MRDSETDQGRIEYVVAVARHVLLIRGSTLCNQIKQAVWPLKDCRSSAVAIENACRAFFKGDIRTFLERHPQYHIQRRRRLTTELTMAIATLVAAILFFAFGYAAKDVGSEGLRPNAEPGPALLSYAGIAGSMVGLLFAVFVFSAERAVDRLGRCGFLLTHVLRRSGSLVCAGFSLGVVVSLSIAGILAEYSGCEALVAGSLFLSIPALMVVAVLTLYLLQQALRFAQGNVLTRELAEALASTHAGALRINARHKAAREAFRLELERRGGTYSPYTSLLFQDNEAVDVELTPNRTFLDFDLSGLDELLHEIRKHWPKAQLAVSRLVGDDWSTPPKVGLISGVKRGSTPPLEPMLRAAFGNQARGLFILKRRKKPRPEEDELARVIDALPHIARDESVESFANVLEILEQYATAELAKDLHAASGRIFDFWEHRRWHDVVDAVLEVQSRPKLEEFWSFLQNIRYAAASMRDAAQLESVMVMQRVVVWRALDIKSPFLGWLMKAVDDSLATPSFFSGITSYRRSDGEELPENASELEALYIRHCLRLEHYFHEHRMTDESSHTLDRLVDRYNDLVGIDAPLDGSVPTAAVRYHILGVIYMLGWAIWKLGQREDAIAEQILSMLITLQLDTHGILDAWSNTPGAEEGGRLIEHPHSWERPGEMRSGKTYSSPPAAFPNLGYVAALLISDEHLYRHPAVELNEGQLRIVDSDRLASGVQRLENIPLAKAVFERVTQKTLEECAAKLEKIAAPIRTKAIIRDLQDVVDRRVDPQTLSQVAAHATEKLSAAYASSPIFQAIIKAAKPRATTSDRQTWSETFVDRFFKATLLRDESGVQEIQSSAFLNAEQRLELRLSEALASLGDQPSQLTPDESGLKQFTQRFDEITARGAVPIAIVCSHEHLTWLCGDRFWTHDSMALGDHQRGDFHGTPVIYLPLWTRGEILILTAAHFAQTSDRLQDVRAVWTSDTTADVQAKLAVATSDGAKESLPEKSQVFLTLESSITFPFSIVCPPGDFRFTILTTSSAS